MVQMTKILVVEDEPNLRKLLEVIIGKEGYHVMTLDDGEAALGHLDSFGPDLIISDVMMPRLGGLELCRKVRSMPQYQHIPFILLTAKDDPTDKYQGFREGADDYVVKPFDPVELLFRVEAHLRRSRQHFKSPSEILSVGSLELDRRNYQAKVGERSIQLTKSEFAMLYHLMTHADHVVSTESILVEALGYPPHAGSSEIIRTHIRNIRQKIEEDPANPAIIQTVARHGYTIKSA
jgi:DNA-binding response OmpR family regulator